MRHSQFALCLLVLSFLAALLVACSKGSAAKKAFSKELSCPEDQIQVTERADLDPYQVMVKHRPSPPAEVAKDPARLALWEKEQAKQRDFYKMYTLYDVEGCNTQRRYSCFRARTGPTCSPVSTR